MTSDTNEKDLRELITERTRRKIIPPFLKECKPGVSCKSYYVDVLKIVKRDDGSTVKYKMSVPRNKAFRLINNRPYNWSYANPLVSFKHTYELV